MPAEVIGDFLPSAVGVALSPIPIIAVIIMLATPRARTSGTAFAAGWIAGLLVVSSLLLAASDGGDAAGGGTHTTLAVAQLGFGLVFFALAVHQWRCRPRPGDAPRMPVWMAKIDALPAAKCFVLGALLSAANPKNLALTISSIPHIGQADISTRSSIVAMLVFVAIGSATVIAAVGSYLVAGARATGPLTSVKSFLVANVAPIMIVLLTVLGAKLVGSSLVDLTA